MAKKKKKAVKKKAESVSYRPAKKRKRKKREKSIQISLRFPVSLLDRIDRYQDQLQEVHPSFRVKRADTIRFLLFKALDDSDGH